MAFVNIDATHPVGSEKGKMLDDYIRELKEQVEANLAEISGYPTNVATKTAVWETAGRPATPQANLTGYNTTLGASEYWDGDSWAQMGAPATVNTAFVQALVDAVVPIGSIMMWSGAVVTIPAKWHLADGTNGTIDLRDKFVVGAGNSYAVAATGGEATHTLTINEMPSHTHNTQYYGHSSDTQEDTKQQLFNAGAGWTYPTTSTGGGTAHENRPPYYAIAFIQRIS
jgi:hypothetical protein